MFAGKLLTDFPTVASTTALTVCFVIFLVASSPTLTGSSRTAPSFRVGRTRHRARQLLGACDKDRQDVQRSFRSRVDIERRVDRSVTALCRHHSACPRSRALERIPWLTVLSGYHPKHPAARISQRRACRQRRHADAKSNGAQFLTESLDRKVEIRCHLPTPTAISSRSVRPPACSAPLRRPAWRGQLAHLRSS
jgi:hypothetical protein